MSRTTTRSGPPAKPRGMMPGWAIGAIVTLVILVLLVGGILVGSFLFLRGAVRDFERADASVASIVDRHGPIDAYRPPPDGVPAPDRIERFLLAREETAPARRELERALSVLSGEGEAGALRKTAAGARLPGDAAAFIEQRNKALERQGMGLGEYTYLYALAYYAWLGESPADGPSFELVDHRGYVLSDLPRKESAETVRARRDELVRTSLNRLLRSQLYLQLADVESDRGQEVEWQRRLAYEIALLEKVPQRIPWQDDPPQAMVAALEPYRGRFEAGYDPMCNALEVGLARR